MILKNLDLQDKDSKSSVIKYRLYLQLMKNVDIENFPKAKNATIEESVLKVGFNFIYVDVKQGSIVPDTEPGQAPTDLKLIVGASIEGVSPDSLSWFYSLNGERVILIWERCVDNQKFIAGSPCSGGMLMSGKIGKLDDGLAGISLTFTGGECPEPIWFYNGPIEIEDDTDDYNSED